MTTDRLETNTTDQATLINGPVFILGDHVQSKDILGPEYLSFDLDSKEDRLVLAGYALADTVSIDGRPFQQFGRFGSVFRIILAGHAFGADSSRPHAVTALASAGVKAIVARSFGSGFYRVAVNSGEILPLVVSTNIAAPFDGISSGELAMIDPDASLLKMKDTNQSVTLENPGVALDIFRAGGLIAWSALNRSRP